MGSPSARFSADLGNHGCMVRRLFPSARLAVDRARRASRGKRRGQQNVVDAQACVAAEREHPVIPPREALFGLLEAAERIDEAEREQLLEVRALLRRDEVLADPFRRIVHVLVVRRDIEIAEQRQPWMALQFFLEPRMQRVEPLQLVDELVGFRRLPVREIGADDARAVDGYRDHALLRVVEAGDVAHHVGFVERQRVACENRHAVVGLLAREPAAVTGGSEVVAREFLVRQFQLLQAEHVGAVAREPVEDVLFAHVEGIHVPGGDFQGEVGFGRSEKLADDFTQWLQILGVRLSMMRSRRRNSYYLPEPTIMNTIRKPAATVFASSLLAGLLTLSACDKQPGAAATTSASNAVASVVAPASAAPVAATYTPPSADQLYRLVAPIALFPDKLVALVLAGAGYPDQIDAANQWRTRYPSLSGTTLAAAVDPQSWAPSVKLLTAFPAVLSQMAQNPAWTTALGQAYANDPTDVMNAIQAMRARARNSGNLKTSKQLVVTQAAPVVVGAPAPDYAPEYLGPAEIPPPQEPIVIASAQPDVVYVPSYDPSDVYGEPVDAYPGYAWSPPPPAYVPSEAVTVGALTFIGVAVGALAVEHSHWGWHSWGVDWGGRRHRRDIGPQMRPDDRNWQRPGVTYNHAAYVPPVARVPAERGGHAWTGGGRESAPQAELNRPPAPQPQPQSQLQPQRSFGGWNPNRDRAYAGGAAPAPGAAPQPAPTPALGSLGRAPEGAHGGAWNSLRVPGGAAAPMQMPHFLPNDERPGAPAHANPRPQPGQSSLDVSHENAATQQPQPQRSLGGWNPNRDRAYAGGTAAAQSGALQPEVRPEQRPVPMNAPQQISPSGERHGPRGPQGEMLQGHDQQRQVESSAQMQIQARPAPQQIAPPPGPQRHVEPPIRMQAPAMPQHIEPPVHMQPPPIQQHIEPPVRMQPPPMPQPQHFEPQPRVQPQPMPAPRPQAQQPQPQHQNGQGAPWQNPDRH